MTRMLRAGATSVRCRLTANARGSPSAWPTNTENSTRESRSALRIVSSSATLSLPLKRALSRVSEASPATTRASGLGVLGVRPLQLGGAGAWTAQPLVLHRRLAGGDPLTADHSRPGDPRPDQDGEQQRGASQPQPRGEQGHGGGSAPPPRHVPAA